MNTNNTFKIAISVLFLLSFSAFSTYAQESSDKEVANPSTGSATQAGSTSAGVGCLECTKNTVQVDRDSKTTPPKNPCYGVREGAACASAPQSSDDGTKGTK